MKLSFGDLDTCDSGSYGLVVDSFILFILGDVWEFGREFCLRVGNWKACEVVFLVWFATSTGLPKDWVLSAFIST